MEISEIGLRLMGNGIFLLIGGLIWVVGYLIQVADLPDSKVLSNIIKVGSLLFVIGSILISWFSKI